MGKKNPQCNDFTENGKSVILLLHVLKHIMVLLFQCIAFPTFHHKCFFKTHFVCKIRDITFGVFNDINWFHRIKNRLNERFRFNAFFFIRISFTIMSPSLSLAINFWCVRCLIEFCGFLHDDISSL